MKEYAFERPTYTKYQISNMVKQKFDECNINKSEFCFKYEIDEKLLESILKAERSFNKKIMKVCARILEVSVDDLISIEIDSMPAYRTEESINNDAYDAYQLANVLFHEIIMQKKLSQI
ncbi:MAG: hypothetical protein RSA01_00435 [Clostridium sp.]|uniref:hypothetical protein n=1 Tax=Clostridium sp. TaxID=1506 RepID=UPI002FCC2C93